MKRPNPKDYNAKDFINGVYEKDLEEYITYLENPFPLPEPEWEEIGEGDYKSEYNGYLLRMEELDRACWWYQIYEGDKELFSEENYAQSMEQAERAILKAIGEEIRYIFHRRGWYKKLFELFSGVYDLVLTQTEISDIIDDVHQVSKAVRHNEKIQGDVEIPVRSSNMIHRITQSWRWITIAFSHLWNGKTLLQQKNVKINIRHRH